MAASLRESRRIGRAKLPWSELEAEAARQGCSPVDIFFDRAGSVVGLPGATGAQDAESGPAGLKSPDWAANSSRGDTDG